MRLAKIENNKVVNIIVSDKLLDGFVECSAGVSIGYGYDGTAFTKPIVLEPEKTFDELKAEKIALAENKYQAEYDKYISKYMPFEISNFDTKQKEAERWEQLSDTDKANPIFTPRINAMVGGDEVKRIELINAILAKLNYVAQLDGALVYKREVIKACTTIAELEAIEV